jgi:hypothetical protein
MEKIALVTRGGASYVFYKTATVTGVQAATWKPANGPGETVEEVIDLQLGGLGSSIETALRLINRLIAQAAAEAADPLGNWVYLECQVLADSPVLRSRVVGGWAELLGPGTGQRSGGSQGARLQLVRLNYWEQVGSEQALLVMSKHNVNSTTARVYNHEDSDAQHGNQVYIEPELNLLPDTPLRVEYTMESAVTTPVTVLIGQSRGQNNALELNIPGTAGSGGMGVTLTPTADSGSAGGNYAKLAWSGASKGAIWGYNLPNLQVDFLEGRPYRPVMRLAVNMTERLFAWIWVMYTSASGVRTAVFQSEMFYLDVSRAMIEGPVVYLPPWAMQRGSGGNPSVRLELWAQAEGSGAHQINLDYVALMPLDGWRVYRPFMGMNGISINDDGETGDVRDQNGAVTHLTEGPGFALSPVENSRLVVAAYQHAGGVVFTAAITLQGLVRVFAKRRQKMV